MSTKTAVLHLPDAGDRRYWEIKHQPQKKTTPLRIELREYTHADGSVHVESWTRLIGFEETIALPESIHEAANKVLERTGRVDEFAGRHGANVREVKPS